MAGIPGIVIAFSAETKGAIRDINGLNKSMGSQASAAEKMGAGIQRAAVPAAAALTAIGAASVFAANKASEQEQAVGALTSVYGANSAEMLRNADAASQIGLSTAQYAQEAAVLGAQLKNMGVAQSELAPQTDELITLGADLAAQFGGETSEAVAALGALMRGERDPIEQFGVSIRQADIDAQKAAMGLTGLTGEADKAADTQATLALLTQQTADAQGAFAREADTAAGSTAIAKAQFADAAAALGAVLLPAIADVMTHLSGFSQWATENPGLIQGVVAAVAALAAGIIAVNVAMKAYAAATVIAKGVQVAWTAAVWATNVATNAYALTALALKAATIAWTAVQWLLNIALTANPIGLIIVAVGVLIAIIAALIYKFRGPLLAAIKKVWEWIKKAAGVVADAFVGAWNALSRAMSAVVRWFKKVWDWIKKILNSGVGKITGLFGGRSMSASVAHTVAPLTVAGATGTAAAGGQGTSVTVSGLVVDPDGIARQMRALERGSHRRGWSPAVL